MIMRALQLLVLFLLPACAATTDELFMEANISGDFTAVNARLEAEAENEIGTPPGNCVSSAATRIVIDSTRDRLQRPGS